MTIFPEMGVYSSSGGMAEEGGS